MSDFLKTKNITNGVKFNSVIDSRFKTNKISINLVTPLKKENVSVNSIIPFLLKKGYDGCSDFTMFHRQLEELYGSYVSAYVQKVGDYQIMSLSITGIDDKFALNNDTITNKLSSILSNLLLKPVLKDGVFIQSEVDLEKKILIDTIEAEINEKRTYAINNLIQTMCDDEPFGIPKYGFKEDVEKLTSKEIKDAYDKLLKTARIEIMFIGCGNDDIAFKVFENAFSNIKRDFYELEKIKAHNISEKTKEKTDIFNVSQSKMVLGFGKKNNSDDKLVLATKLMVAVLGGTPSSKLFVNVREKLSLCYYCAARYDRFKSIMLIDCGVEKQNIESARKEIIAQLNCIQNGDVTDEEISNAMLSLKNALNTVYDSDVATEAWYLGQILSGTCISPMDESNRLSLVSKQDIVNVSNDFSLDTVYVLTGNEVE